MPPCDYRSPIFKRYDFVRDTICPPECYDDLGSFLEVAPNPDGDTIVTEDAAYTAWNISDVDSNIYIRGDIRNPTDPHAHYRLEFGWMSVDEFIAYQMEMFDTNIRTDRIAMRKILLRGISSTGYSGVRTDQRAPDYGWNSFWLGVDTDRVMALAKHMLDGDIFRSLFIAYNRCGHFDQQEGRHRALAAKMVGCDKIPVWKARAR